MTAPYQRARAIALAGVVLHDLSQELEQEISDSRRLEFLALIRQLMKHYPNIHEVRDGSSLTALYAARSWEDPWIEPWKMWEPRAGRKCLGEPNVRPELL